MAQSCKCITKHRYWAGFKRTGHFGDGEGVGALVLSVNDIFISDHLTFLLLIMFGNLSEHFLRAIPNRLDPVFVGFDEEILPALSRDVQPASSVVDDSGMDPGSADAGLLEHKMLFLV